MSARARASAAFTVLVLSLTLVSTAAAEVRSLAVVDPQDATPTISGVPNSPDIQGLQVTYDSAGSLTLQVTFYNAPSSLDRSQNYAFWSAFSVATATPYDGLPDRCSSSSISGQHHVFAERTTFYDRASISGLDGVLQFTRTTSADGKTVTVTASSPALANRDLRCVSYELRARRYSTAASIYSDYDESCNCWYVSNSLDTVGTVEKGGVTPEVWFDGYAPGPQPACNDGIDNDGDGYIDYPGDNGCATQSDTDEQKPVCSNGEDDDHDGVTDLEDPGCGEIPTGGSEADPPPVPTTLSLKAKAYRCRIATAASVLPDIAPKALFPWGKLRMQVRGPRYDQLRRLPLKKDSRYSFRLARSGRYTVRSWYPGDTWRVKSRTGSKVLRVSGCQKPKRRK